MKLFELGIPYLRISRDVLLLHSRTAILEMLRLCGGQYALDALKRGTPYQRRRQNEALRELERAELVSLANGIPSLAPILPHKQSEIPSCLPWDSLTFAELKVILALYIEARHSRSPYFSYEGRYEDLAELAKVSRQAVGIALSALAAKGFCSTKPARDEGSRTTRGTLVQLMDLESGASLNDLGWFFRNRLGELDVVTRYKLALRPQMDYHSGLTAESGMRLTCPLCLNANRTFRVTATEETDRWHCFACMRSGNSAKLCALRSFWLWKEEPFNLAAIQAYMGIEQGGEITNASV